ncbi:MAG: hypothetical protein KGM49_09385 [Sphingomonadales bacterium]|nr:hypothetical protein [Sphingomonadales bacterium]
MTAQDVSRPQEGFYRHRLSGRSVVVGVRIHYGPPLDPVTGEELDRSWRWQSEVNGDPYADFDRIWPGCTGDPITEAEYRNYCNRQRWAREHAPESSYAEPGRRHDPLSSATPLPF